MDGHEKKTLEEITMTLKSIGLTSWIKLYSYGITVYTQKLMERIKNSIMILWMTNSLPLYPESFYSKYCLHQYFCDAGKVLSSWQLCYLKLGVQTLYPAQLLKVFT